VKLLLDTHIFIWFLAGDSRLNPSDRALIESPSQQCFVSIVTAWEIAIKMSLGKLTMQSSFNELFPTQLQANGMTLLSLELAHVNKIMTLPFHHRDPFDRLLIAQAVVDNLVLLSYDSSFNNYDFLRPKNKE
jgi:PIN domain nuclease of toxin-antitoxin system